MSRKKNKGPSVPEPRAGPALRFPGFPAHWLAAAWTLLVAVLFIRRGVRLHPSVLEEFLRLTIAGGPLLTAALPDLARLGLIWLVLAGLGKAVARALGVTASSGMEGLVFAGGLGLWAGSLILLGAGLFGAWRPAWLRGAFYPFAAAAAGYFIFEFRRETTSGPPGAAAPRSGARLWEAAAYAIILCAATLGLLAALTPEIFYDALVYHLGLPKLFLLRGAIVPVPYSIYSGLPLGIQMLYGLALALSGETLACLFHWSLGLAAAAALWAWARRYQSAETGALACLLFYLCPAVMYAGWHAGVDLGSSFLCLGAFLALCRSLEDPAASDGLGWSILAGLLTGAGMGTKYNVFPIGALLVAVHAAAGRRRGAPFRWSAAMAVAAVIAVLPWLAKNAAFFGNPLYPFLHDIMGSSRPAHWDRFVSDASRGLGSLATMGGIRDVILQPWTTSLGDWPLGDWPGPAYLMLVPWTVLVSWGGFPQEALALAAAGGYGGWALASRLFRYFLPALGFLSLATAVAIDRGLLPGWARRAGWAAALLFCAYGFESAYFQGRVIGVWDYLRAPNKAAYLRKERITYSHPYYSAMEFVNKSIPEKSRILFIGEARGYYCERDFIAPTVFDFNPFWEDLRASPDAAELLGRLRARGVTHLFLNAWELASRREYSAVFPRDAIRSPLFAEFWARGLRSLYEERDDSPPFPRWLAVYELRPALGEASRGPANVPLAVLKSLERLEASRKQ